MKTQRTWTGLALLGCALLLGGCAQPAQQAEIPVVRTEVVGADGNAAAATYAGEVRGRYESKLGFQVGGKIVARPVELGTAVAAGDVLLALDPKDLAQNEAAMAAQVESANAQLRLAEANMNRYRQLYAESAVSAAAYEQYRTTYEAAEAAAKQARAQYAQGANALGYARLTADAAGVVSAIDAEVGQVVAAGQSVVTLVRAGELEVEINVPENRLGEIAARQDVAVSFWALDGLTADGTVREVAPMADKATKTYRVRVAVSEPPEGMRLGMTASVKLRGKTDATLYEIPLAAIYQDGDQPRVWLVEDGAVRLRAVEVASFGDNTVKIAAGLNGGDRVVTAGVHKLREGQKVRLGVGDAS